MSDALDAIVLVLRYVVGLSPFTLFGVFLLALMTAPGRTHDVPPPRPTVDDE